MCILTYRPAHVCVQVCIVCCTELCDLNVWSCLCLTCDLCYRYWDSILNMLFPRFEHVLQVNIRSIKDCDPKRLGNIDVRPHYVCEVTACTCARTHPPTHAPMHEHARTHTHTHTDMSHALSPAH